MSRYTLLSYERELRRRQKEAERIEKARIQRSEQEAAALAVQEYDEKISRLKTLHCKNIRILDWAALASCHPPIPPTKKSHEHDKVERLLHCLEAFGPVTEITNKRAIAQAADDNAHAIETRQYVEEMGEYEKMRALSAKVLAGENAAYETVLNECTDLCEVSEEEEDFTFTIHSAQP